MASVKVEGKGEEALSKALNKFSTKVYKERILQQHMNNRFYTKPSEEKREQKKRETFKYKLKNKYL